MRLDRRVTLQYKTNTVTTDGDYDDTPVDYRNCWAKLIETSGSEGTRGDQVEHHGRVVVRIRHTREGQFPSVEDRVSVREGDTGTTRTLEVAHVQRIGSKRQFLDLHCIEVG